MKNDTNTNPTAAIDPKPKRKYTRRAKDQDQTTAAVTAIEAAIDKAVTPTMTGTFGPVIGEVPANTRPMTRLQAAKMNTDHVMNQIVPAAINPLDDKKSIENLKALVRSLMDDIEAQANNSDNSRGDTLISNLHYDADQDVYTIAQYMGEATLGACTYHPVEGEEFDAETLIQGARAYILDQPEFKPRILAQHAASDQSWFAHLQHTVEANDKGRKAQQEGDFMGMMVALRDREAAPSTNPYLDEDGKQICLCPECQSKRLGIDLSWWPDTDQGEDRGPSILRGLAGLLGE